jgi:hypothetical protein
MYNTFILFIISVSDELLYIARMSDQTLSFFFEKNRPDQTLNNHYPTYTLPEVLKPNLSARRDPQLKQSSPYNKYSS